MKGLAPSRPSPGAAVSGLSGSRTAPVATTTTTILQIRKALGDSFQGSMATGSWGVGDKCIPRVKGNSREGKVRGGPRQAVLVVEYDVWPPHKTAGDADGIQATIVIRVPS